MIHEEIEIGNINFHAGTLDSKTQDSGGESPGFPPANLEIQGKPGKMKGKVRELFFLFLQKGQGTSRNFYFKNAD